MADVNSGPCYTIRAFDVAHLKVKVSLQIPKCGFQGVSKFKNKCINLAWRKEKKQFPLQLPPALRNGNIFFLQSVMRNAINYLKFCV